MQGRTDSFVGRLLCSKRPTDAYDAKILNTSIINVGILAAILWWRFDLRSIYVRARLRKRGEALGCFGSISKSVTPPF